MLYILIIFLIVAVEWFVKDTMEKKLDENRKLELPFGRSKIYFYKFHNTGAAFNFMNRYPECMKTFHAVTLFYVFVLMLREKNSVIKFGLSLLAGGGLSNFIDRYRKGYVMDYFSFRFGAKWFQKLVFNLSDFCVLAGALVFCAGQLKKRGE